MFYSQGMLVSVYSVRKRREEGLGWFKGGENIGFNRVNLSRTHHQDTYYSLYFEYEFEHPNDEVYFSLTQPYTYSRLSATIDSLKHHTPKGITLEVKTLAYSISNNIIPLLRFGKEGRSYNQAILVMGRQHPCETVGSFIGEALMRELLKESQVSEWLLD